LQEKIFKKLFEQAEIAQLTPDEMRTYEEMRIKHLCLKTYWDNYSVLETAKKEGASERDIEIAKLLKKEGDPIEKIARITGLTKEEIEKL
jgi:predicted transposase/invertase (TIGR01784 family)